jgi:hypothetical protein
VGWKLSGENELMANFALRRIAFLGNYLPRRCEIATFTRDLREAVNDLAAETQCFTVAMNNRPGGYPYPSLVRFEVEQKRREQYEKEEGVEFAFPTQTLYLACDSRRPFSLEKEI